MNREQEQIAKEIIDFANTPSLFAGRTAGRDIYHMFCKLSAVAGGPDDVMQEYDVDKIGMQEFARLLGPSYAMPILVKIAKKYGGSEWEDYVGEIIAEVLWEVDDHIAARQAKEWANGNREMEARALRLRETTKRNNGRLY